LSSHDDHCVVNVNRILSLFIPSFDYIYHCDSSITINIVSTKQVRKDAQNISPETIGSEFRIMQGSSGFQGYKNLRGNMLHLKKHGIRMDQTIRDMAAKISPLLSFTHGCHVRKISLA